MDATGNVYVTGSTTSGDFPVHGTPAPAQANNNGGEDAFVTELNPTGSGLIYSTYLGGSGNDSGQGIVTDGTGASYIVGTTTSTDLAATAGAIQTTAGGGTCGGNPCHDAFLAKIDSTGSAISYLTYLGGSGDDFGNGIALDSSLNIYLVGSTTSSSFTPAPTAGAFQSALGTGAKQNAFFAKLGAISGTPASSPLLYLTYMGGGGTDSGNAIAVDSLDNAYLAGSTTSTDFPTTSGVFQTALAGTQNAFVAKLNPANAGAASLVYSTYLGGNGTDSGNGIAVNGNGDAHVVGSTTSTNFPTFLPTQAANGGGEDGFGTKFDTSGAALIFSTYVGGSGSDTINGVALSSSVYFDLGFAGTTNSSSGAPFFGGYQGGPSDAIWGYFGNLVIAIASVSPTTLTFPDQIKGTTSSPLPVKITNDGDASLSISSVTINGDFSIQTNGCGGTLASNSSCDISVLFSPSTTGTRTGTLTINDSAANNPNQTIALTGRGVSAGVPAFSPTSLTFAAQPVFTTTSQQTMLTNTGTGPMVISSISAAAPFGATSNCPISPTALTASGSCTVTVTFTPTAYGPVAGQVTMVDDAAGSPQTVPLSGTGQAPVVSLSPASLSFGNIAEGSSSATQTSKLTISGTLALNLTNIAASAGYSQTNDCPASLGIGAFCTITVTFSPTTVGSIPGTISISDNALDSPESVALTGIGTGVGIAIVPPNLTFVDQTVGVQSAYQQITLSNTGNAPLTLSLSLTGLFPSDFSETDNCGSSVPGPGSCTIQVFFTPSAAQSESATLEITDNAPHSPQIVNLTGTGLDVSTAPSQAYTMTRGDYGTGGSPSSMVGDDFNNDGRPDLVVANRLGNSISVLLAAPNGTFKSHYEVPTGRQPVYAVGGDFNNDGNRDLAVANYKDNTVSILLGNGNGTFKPQVTYATGNGPVWIATGDFNNDSNTDLVIVNSTDGTVTILLGKGDGTFTAAPKVPVGPSPTSVAVGDFNADGPQDLAVTNSGNNTVSILLGVGDGTFNATSTPLATGADPVAIASGHFNRNYNGQSYFQDLAVANFKDKTVSIFLNAFNVPSAGAFQTPTTLSTGLGPSAVKILDFNGDGNNDIAVTYSNCGTISLSTPCFKPGFVAIFSGNGDGTFQTSPTQFAVGSGVAALGTDDFNLDGVTDLVAANSSDNSVTVLLGQSQGLFTTRTDLSNGSVTNASAVVMGDFNGDKIQDVAVANYDTSSVSVFIGNADGTFKAPVTYSTGMNPSALVAGDFNRDGNLDLAATNFTDGTVSILTGSSTGTFTAGATTAVGAGPVAMVTGDFNNDNLLDLAVANSKDNTISILTGNGSGGFTAAGTINVGVNPVSLAAGKFGSDTNLDLAVADQGSNNLLVLRGKGDGTFQTAVPYATGSKPSFVAAADVNGDTTLDLVETNAGDDTVSVLIGKGDGTFNGATNYATATSPTSLAIGDFNGDNIMDLAVGAQVTGCSGGAGDVSVLLGAGGGQFHAKMDYATSSCPTAITSGTIGTSFPRSLVLANSNGTASAFENRPVAALSQTSVTFPTTYVGNVSSPVTVTLSNPSGAPLSLSQIVTSGPFTETPTCTVPGSIGVGFNCPINISYAPSASGAATGSVTITDNIQAGSQVIPLSGNGTTSNLSLDKTSLDFTGQFVGVQSSPLTVTITSTGTANLQMQNITPSGTNVADFSSYGCAYSTLTNGSTCQINVYFTASGTTPESATLSINDNGPNSPQTVTLSGTATNPVPSISYLSPGSATAGEAGQTLSIYGSGFISSSTVTYNGVAHTATFVSSTQLTIQLTAGDQATGGSFAVVVTNPAPGGGTSSPFSFPVDNPSPSIGSLSPASALTGAAAQTLTINGTGFVLTSTVTYNGVAHTATFASSTKLSILLTASDQATAGNFAVAVTNPAPGGGTSSVVNFEVDQAPAITSAKSATFTAGTAGSFSVTATGFPAPTLSETGALPSGVSFDTSTGVISGKASATGTYPLSFTASNGVSPDATQSFTLTVNNPVLTITSLSPNSATAGAVAQTLTINGTGFVSTSSVTYNGVAHTATFVSSTQLTIQLTASDQATGGSFAVVVTNPAPGGGASNAVNFSVQDVSVGPAPGSSNSATISPGQTASYELSVTPVDGFSQAVTLACSGAPSEATCTISPNSVTPVGTNPAAVTVNVTTTASSLASRASAPPGPRGPAGSPFFNPQSPIRAMPGAIGAWLLARWIVLCLLALIAGVAAASRRRPASPVWMPSLQPSPWARLRARLILGGSMLVVLLWASCGGGGGSTGGGGGGNPGTPAGTYTLTVTATSGTVSRSTTLTLSVQ